MGNSITKLLFFFLLLGQLGATAQRVNQCGYIIPPQSLRSSFQSIYEAGAYINQMLDSIKWKENFVLREQNGINNAYATIVGNKRYIVYDNNFLENLDEYAGTKAASLSVLAHEMGHHYRNHVLDSRGSTPPKEIEADYFSGYVMAKMGVSLQESKAAMERIASPQASSSHPGRVDRLAAIERGWNYAQGINTPNPTGPTTSPTPTPTPMPAPQPQQNPPPASNDASWIYLFLYGNSEMTVFLSDNGRDYSAVRLSPTQPFVFKYEIYKYGWMKFGTGNSAKVFRLHHGRDYAIIWSRRSNSWTVISVP